MQPLFKLFLKKLLRTFGIKTNSETRMALSDEERREIVARMDAGDFDFSADLIIKMKHDWHIDPACVPYPTVLVQAMERGDTDAQNHPDMMEICYRLPYSFAYEDSQADKYRELIDVVIQKGWAMDGRVVADIGCGFGGLLEQVHRGHRPAELIGVEVAHSPINWMRNNRPHIKGCVASLDMPSGAWQSSCNFHADVVFCTEVLEHLLRPESALANLMALRKKNGVLVLSVPNGRADTAAQHINFWSPESWQRFLETTAAGSHIETFLLNNPHAPGGSDIIALIS